MKRPLYIIGAGGHGKVVAEAAIASDQFHSVAFLDSTPGKIGQMVVGCKVVATSHEEVTDTDALFHVAIGDNKARLGLCRDIISSSRELTSVQHPNTIVSKNCEIGCGVAIMAGSIVQSGAKIGDGCILNTACSIDHDCILGNAVHISPGVTLAGNVAIGDSTWVGAGATVINNITIAAELKIGAGAVVVDDLNGQPDTTFVGIPARVKHYKK